MGETTPRVSEMGRLTTLGSTRGLQVGDGAGHPALVLLHTCQHSEACQTPKERQPVMS